MELSKRVQSVPKSGIRKMFALADKYENIINLCIGEPGFKTPQNIVDATKEILEEGQIKYTATIGMDKLREAVKNKLENKNKIKVDSIDNIIITPGAGKALAISLLAIINPGDEVMVPNPHWPNYLGHIALSGGKAVHVDTFEEDGFNIKAEAIKERITEKTKAIILNSPSNPTGTVIPEEELVKIGKLAKENGIIILSDEPYEEIIYDGLSNFSIGSVEEFKDNVITINSFSKTYAMTGWRIGYAHGPRNIIEAMVKIQENLSTCVNDLSQHAALEALNGPQDTVKEMAEEYKERRDILVNGLNELEAVTCAMPQGTFFALANIKQLNMTSDEVSEKIIEEVQVVTTPGTAFGSAGEGYIRLSFASDKEDIIEAIERLKRCSLFKK